MARHNEATLYGRVAEAPSVKREDPADPEGRALEASIKLTVIRGIRSTGAKDRRMRLDGIPVRSGDPQIAGMMAELEEGDMVLVRGTVATKDTERECGCPECGRKLITYKSCESYVSPVYMRLMASGLSEEEGTRDLKRNAEISDRVTVIGKACGKPKIHRHEKSGTYICSYPLDVERKFRIRGSGADDRHDFPIVNYS